MSRLSDYITNHRLGPFGDPYDDAPFVNFDRHHKNPCHRRSDPENVPYDVRLPRNQSDNFLSERHDFRLSERYSRGYNPPYNGTPSSVAGSDPGRDDYGFEFEDHDYARYTPMGDGYSEYKNYGQQSHDLALGYSARLKAVGTRPPRKQQREEYVGSPSLTREHHREMYGLASRAANAAYTHHEARSQFDKDYRYLYKNPKHREGHVRKIDEGRESERKLRLKERSHQKWL